MLEAARPRPLPLPLPRALALPLPRPLPAPRLAKVVSEPASDATSSDSKVLLLLSLEDASASSERDLELPSETDLELPRPLPLPLPRPLLRPLDAPLLGAVLVTLPVPLRLPGGLPRLFGASGTASVPGADAVPASCLGC